MAFEVKEDDETFLHCLFFNDFCNNWEQGVILVEPLNRTELIDKFARIVKGGGIDSIEVPYTIEKRKYKENSRYLTDKSFDLFEHPTGVGSSVKLLPYAENYAKKAVEKCIEHLKKKFEVDEDQARYDEIYQRQIDLCEYSMGRSLHPYKDAKEFSSALAKHYADDVSWLMKKVKMKPSLNVDS